MYTEMALTARKFALTLAVAGVAAMGSVALAPAASAAPAVVQDGPGTVIEKTTGNGPDQFLVGEHGRRPIFICDVEEPKKHAKKCIDLTAPTRF
jgi:hypothetical protein